MTRPEWIEGVALMRVNWPHVALPDKTALDKWFSELAQYPGEQIKAAIEALYRDGREFPPNGAQILGKLSELARDDSDWGEAWGLAKRANLKADPKEGMAWLEARSHAAAETVRRISSGDRRFLLSYQLADESTVRAQFRDIYRTVCGERKRDDTYAGLPSAGLRGLERGPRHLGKALLRALPEEARKQLEEQTS